MLNREMSLTDALAYVKQRGRIANPYFGFMNKTNWRIGKLRPRLDDLNLFLF